MLPTKPTLKDLSKMLNVSVATVSKALNGYPDVNSKTREKVRTLAKELNFTPNQQAIDFRKKSTRLIGVVLPRVNHYYFSNLAEYLIEHAAKDGISVIFKPTFENVEKEEQALCDLVKQNVDGILISLSNETRSPVHLVETHKKGIPIVEFDRISKLSPFDKVVTDDRQAAKKATQHLIAQGRKTIAHLRGPLLSQNAIDRFLGYKNAIDIAGLEYNDELVVQVEPNNLGSAKHAFSTLFKIRADIDAVFTVTDIVAVGVLEALKEQGVNVPKQVSVVGFSNWQLSKFVTPSLTTVDQNAFTLANIAYELLKKNIEEGAVRKREKETVYVKTDLIIRNSS